MSGRRDHDGPDLLVGKEFDGSIGEDAKKSCRMPAKEAAYAVLAVDVAHSRHHAKPRASVFGELRIGGLEQDFDPVKRSNYSLGL